MTRRVVVLSNDSYNEAEGRRLLADPDMQRCMNPRTLDDILCCYGDCPPNDATSIPLNGSAPHPERSNEMPCTCNSGMTSDTELKQLRAEVAGLRHDLSRVASRERIAGREFELDRLDEADEKEYADDYAYRFSEKAAI